MDVNSIKSCVNGNVSIQKSDEWRLDDFRMSNGGDFFLRIWGKIFLLLTTLANKVVDLTFNNWNRKSVIFWLYKANGSAAGLYSRVLDTSPSIRIPSAMIPRRVFLII